MKVTLIIKKSAKRNDTESLATVYARVRDGRRLDCTVSTKLEVNPNQWDNSKGHLKDRIIIDKDVKAKIDGVANEIVTFINKEYAQATEPIDKDWVEMTIDKFYNPQKYIDPEENKNMEVIPMYEYYLEMHPLSEVRQRNNRVIIRALKRYEMFIRKTKRGKKEFSLLLNDVTPDTLHSIWNYFKKEHTFVEEYPELFEEVPEARKPKPRGENTLIDYFCKIRTFFIWCYDNEFTRNRPFDKFHIDEPVYGTPVYITLEERDQIAQCDFSEDPKLDLHRDLFVFQSCIGCRVSDLWAMTKQSVVDSCIEYIAGKKINGDPQTIRVPLNSIAKAILEKYEDYAGPALFPFGFQQDYNEDLKAIFKKAGVDRTVTILNPTTRKQEHVPIYEVAASHMARRTFIGNMYKKVKDKSMVGMLSGHKSDSKAFDRYWTPDDDIRQSLVDMLV
jgi:site-specific recombinase XerD